MAYISLYRKYRPKSFSDVYGQDIIVKTLKNLIKNEKLSHAYLFTGQRGTGKTFRRKRDRYRLEEAFCHVQVTEICGDHRRS